VNIQVYFLWINSCRRGCCYYVDTGLQTGGKPNGSRGKTGFVRFDLLEYLQLAANGLIFLLVAYSKIKNTSSLGAVGIFIAQD